MKGRVAADRKALPHSTHTDLLFSAENAFSAQTVMSGLVQQGARKSNFNKRKAQDVHFGK